MIGVAPALCSCVPLHSVPVAACAALADGSHPSSGPLEVLPSEVPGVQLDSMRWDVHTGRDPEAFDTWIGVSAVGRMVSTKEASLVGVGVLVEGMRDDVVVHRMIDSSFRELRRTPGPFSVYEYVARETVRPDRPVPVGAADRAAGTSPPARWGCPSRARIVRLSPPGVVLRAPRPPEDERPSSVFYAWNPWTFSVDTVMQQRRGEVVLLRGPRGHTPRTDVAIVRSKILYRRFEPDGIRADSSTDTGDDLGALARQRDSAQAHARRPEEVRDPSTATPTPNEGETILMIRFGGPRYEWRFPTESPPTDLAPIVQTMSRIGDRMAPTAHRYTPKS